MINHMYVPGNYGCLVVGCKASKEDSCHDQPWGLPRPKLQVAACGVMPYGVHKHNECHDSSCTCGAIDCACICTNDELLDSLVDAATTLRATKGYPRALIEIYEIARKEVKSRMDKGGK